MVEQIATNIKWQERKVSLADYETRNKHKGAVVWLTGLSASGKSTVAVESEKILFDRGVNVYLLDGDNVRHGLNKDLGFSHEARIENIRRIAELAKLFRNAGFVVLCAFISPYKADREIARELIEENRFFETYIKCDIEECKNRDPKGLYKKAIEGLIPDFTGISAPYEEPDHPEIVIDTEHQTIQESAQILINKLEDNGII